jgi:16S rRNA U1498 N3-methylase RsmE
MSSKDFTSSAAGQCGANSVQERAEATVALQKEILEAYEQASRAWLARVRSEVAV